MRLRGGFKGRRGRSCGLGADRSLAGDPERLRRAFADLKPPRPALAPRSNGYQGGGNDELAQIDPLAYFSALAGIEVAAQGSMVKCPLPDHEDSYASCQVFPEAQRGWGCYGCSRGGRIYDLASLLSGGAWGRDLRGEAFRAAGELVAAALRQRAPSAGEWRPPDRLTSSAAGGAGVLGESARLAGRPLRLGTRIGLAAASY